MNKKTTVHIHLGPHKTGSTAIQHAIEELSCQLKADFDLGLGNNKFVQEAAQLLNLGEQAAAKSMLRRSIEQSAATSKHYLISCEDLSGDLPGRTVKRRPYPTLWENINFIRHTFDEFDCKFYFFVRDVEHWLMSAYVQNLKHRQKFSSYEDFREFIRTRFLWEGVIGKPSNKLGEDFITIPYSEDSGYSSDRALLRAILGMHAVDQLRLPSVRPNKTPEKAVISILEMINSSGASRHAKKEAKSHVLEESECEEHSLSNHEVPLWNSRPHKKPDWLNRDLDGLWDRVNQRVHKQEQPNFLPDIDADLSTYRRHVVSASDVFPTGGRGEMRNQKKILEYRFRGMPQICLILGMAISYLRRDTPHTEHASLLFQRLWREEYKVLLGSLQTRWLISSFQTFMDHGANEAQRLVGASAYFFANLLKAYEAERALDGLPADSVYPNTTPTTPGKFPGLDRFKLGGTDMLLNTNALLLEVAANDDAAGRIVQEFVLRMMNAHSIFSRMDASRKHYEIDIAPFSNCWSFFVEPQ